MSTGAIAFLAKAEIASRTRSKFSAVTKENVRGKSTRTVTGSFEFVCAIFAPY
jgi:hypothetical protein